MNNEQFKNIMEGSLKRLFPGIESSVGDIGAQRNDVTYNRGGGTELSIKTLDESQSLRIVRSQMFTPIEKLFIENLVSTIKSLKPLNDGLAELLSTKLYSLAIGNTLTEDNNKSKLIAYIIDLLETWSTETYEGKNITASFLLNDDYDVLEEPTLSSYSDNDFAKVLSNGFDSVIEVNSSGKVVGYFCPPNSHSPSWKCPYRYANISSLTKGNSKISFLLNRNGEILIFREDELIFARRRGTWLIFSHDTLVRKIACGISKFDEEIRRQVYASALDVSFSRTGGSITYFTKTKEQLGLSKLIAPKDQVHLNQGIKSQIFNLLTHKEFDKIDRRIRQEIIGIDGATIINYSKKLIVVGAIIRVNPGSDEGGRAAASKALSEYGISLKVSADGKISVYAAKEKEFTFG